jgi:polyhydroxybutyrate depolymerase
MMPTSHTFNFTTRFVAMGLVPLLLAACSGSSNSSNTTTVGNAGLGGSSISKTSGAPSTSGGSGTGGAATANTAIGGISTGGSATQSTAASTGGINTGGATQGAGGKATGGVTQAAGGKATGGAATGGATQGAGGKATGGVTQAVGGKATGGAATGGATPNTGGNSSSGECPATSPFKAGDNTQTLTVGELDRTYIVHVPSSYTGKTAVPLLFDFHGMGTTGAQEEAFDTWNKYADKQGFIAVYPDGTDKSWNAGSCCPSASTNKIDDVGFVRAIITKLETQLCIDAKRIYATGCSNGGAMSYRIACEAADVFAAVAPVDFDLALNPCTPKRPITEIQFRGTDDEMVPYSGAQPNFKKWGQLNQCTGDPAAMPENSSCQAYPQCADGAETILCTVQAGSHCGNYSTFKIPEVAWAVLTRHTLP